MTKPYLRKPYLQSCQHSKKGWCLDCVRELIEKQTAEIRDIGDREIRIRRRFDETLEKSEEEIKLLSNRRCDTCIHWLAREEPTGGIDLTLGECDAITDTEGDSLMWFDNDFYCKDHKAEKPEPTEDKK